MRHLAKIAVTAIFAVLVMVATVVPAQAVAWPLHPFHTSGQAGVSASGKYARATLNGKRAVAVRANIYDGLRDGKYAGIVVHWKSGKGATSVAYMWNTGGRGTTATGRVVSNYWAHLYIKECIGVNPARWRPTNCGPFHKYF